MDIGDVVRIGDTEITLFMKPRAAISTPPTATANGDGMPLARAGEKPASAMATSAGGVGDDGGGDENESLLGGLARLDEALWAESRSLAERMHEMTLGKLLGCMVHPDAGAYGGVSTVEMGGAAGGDSGGGPLGGVRLDDLDVGETLGISSLSVVRLAIHRASRRVLAVKTMRKRHVIHRGHAEHVASERRVLSMLAVGPSSQFVTQLVASMQDTHHIHLVTDVMMGGELRSLLCRCSLEESAARFYIAQAICALEHLHGRSIAHRDLKPENLLIGANGYLKVGDFGLARHLDGERPVCHTLCGTPDYVAPEVLAGDGAHGLPVDWWACGVVLFELVTGGVPFDAPDAMSTFRKVVNAPPAVPPGTSEVATEIILSLLQRAPEERLGCTGRGPADVYAHPFLGEDATWLGALRRMELAAPWTPVLQHPTDTAHFDKFAPDDTPWAEEATDSLDRAVDELSMASTGDVFADF